MCDIESDIDRAQCLIYEAIRTGDPSYCAALEYGADRENCYSAVARQTGVPACEEIEYQFGNFICRQHGTFGEDEVRLREQAREEAEEERRLQEEQLEEQREMLEVMEEQLAAQEEIRRELEEQRAIELERKLEEEREEEPAPAEPTPPEP